MRILVISLNFYPKRDGVVRVAHNQAKNLAKRGHKVLLLTTSKADPAIFTLDGIEVHRLSSVRARNYYVRTFRRFLALRGEVKRLVKSNEIDVIYAIGLLAMMSCAGTGRSPLVLSYQGREDYDLYRHLDKTSHPSNLLDYIAQPFLTRITRQVVKRTDGVVFPTEVSKEHFDDQFELKSGVPQAVISNGIDSEFFVPRNERDDIPTILFVGVLIKRKGIGPLIRSLPLVIERFPNVRLTLVGEGSKEYFARIAANLGVERSVKFLGSVSDRDLLECYQKATVFVMPTFFDAFPTAMLEAMSVGKPVVSTLHSAPQEILRNGQAGFLVSPGDHIELATAITRIIEDPALAERMGRQGVEIVRSKYSLEGAVSKLEDLFRRVIRSQ